MLSNLQTREYPPAFANYVAKADLNADPIDTLEDQLTRTQALLATLPAGKRLYRYAPDKWSIQQLLGHIIDSERIFACRALRIARNDQTPLPGFDQDPYVAAAQADQCDWQSLLDEWESVRRSTIFMLRNWPSAAWTNMGISNNAPVSARALVAIIIGHVEHHLEILRERYNFPSL